MMERNQTKMGPQSFYDQEHSFRLNRIVIQYNINDYLPPKLTSMSRTQLFPSRQMDKIYTEPNDRNANEQVHDFKRVMKRNQEEKQQLKRQIERLNKKIELNGKEIDEKNHTIEQLTLKNNDLENQFKSFTNQKPQLEYSRGNLHFVYFPRFNQRYEVSVQTDAIESPTYISSSFPKPVSLPPKIDREMSEIQEKLAKLNQFKKTAKQKAFKAPEFPTRVDKGEGIGMLGRMQQKQNAMRLSNTFERLSNIPEERIREETIDILPIHIDQVERMIRLYME